MNKVKKIVVGIVAIIVGLLALGIGYSIHCPHPCNTTIFLGGFVLIIIGIILLAIKK